MTTSLSSICGRAIAARPDSTTDAELVAACLTGNQLAWERLIARYRGLINSYARKYGASPSDAADIFQTVCIELYIALPRIRKQDNVAAWIATVAAHETYRWKRRQQVRLQRDTEVLEQAAPEATPLSEFLQSELKTLVREAVSYLPRRHRMVIALLFLTEPPLPYRTVADRLGVMPGSVPFLRQRSLRNLQRLLADLGFLQGHAGGQRAEASRSAVEPPLKRRRRAARRRDVLRGRTPWRCRSARESADASRTAAAPDRMDTPRQDSAATTASSP
jgi:RNA polymerase sigma factor (sigma-70 family)